jgi:ABC-type nitrate/sulfonate/bicarbonate transport system permease component
MRIGHRLLTVLIGAWLPILLIYLWWTTSAESTNPYFPPLSEIWTRFLELWVFAEWPTHVFPSLRNLGVGYAIAVVAGIALGALVGTSRAAARYVEPLIDFFRSIPAVATVPVFIVIFGLEESMRIAAIAVAATWPILLATIQGVRGTDPTLMDTTSVFRVSRARVLWRVRVPGAMPIIFSGLQIGLQIAFVVTIASEFLGSGFGIGAFTLIATDSFLILDAWTGVILMGLLGYAINIIFDIVERVSLRWYYGQKKLS